jgi:hypothetical protein
MPRFIPSSKGLYRKGVKVERIEGTMKVRFTCPKGHASIKNYQKKPGQPGQISPAALDKLVPYWNDAITYTCKKCQKEAN